MIAVSLTEPDDFDGWRSLARRLVAGGHAPEDVVWSECGAGGDLFARNSAPAEPESSAAGAPRELRVSRSFIELAPRAILHRDPARLDLLYRLLWRLQRQPALLGDPADDDAIALHRLVREVRRDIHKMRAFVRFRSLQDADGHERFVAWFEPDHRIERINARFFVDRFASQRWSILTPRLSLHWDGTTLSEGPAGSRTDAPREDAAEELWLGYYRSIFNPARLKVGAMVKEMPRRYWRNMPEARQIPELIAGAQKREAAMIDSGADLFAQPPPDSLDALARGIAECRRCPIGCNGTRAVAGEGPVRPDLMILGEQPGDHEEERGRPFVGPAGQLLDRHLQAAGIDRSGVYVTNAVKHFKFTPRGKRRLHQNPTASEIDHCRWWLDAERELVQPRLILALGASAGRALLGRTPSIGRERGAAIALPDGGQAWLTAHPSYLLRLTGEAQEREMHRFQSDLAALASIIRSGGTRPLQERLGSPASAPSAAE